GRQIFRLLNVEENLLATARMSPGCKWTPDSVYELFPILQERALQPAITLSGGEQQMLSIGRALLTNPSLLIFDEATEGLAPLARRQIWECIKRLKQAGLSILLIDKNLAELLELASRHYILDKGEVVWSGSSAALAADSALAQTYLGL
ncbi:MAG: ATP-binding cassette domain-containing protein, partial [Pseudorhodoplanes sp.]